jgi:hypothetical protein
LLPNLQEAVAEAVVAPETNKTTTIEVKAESVTTIMKTTAGRMAMMLPTCTAATAVPILEKATRKKPPEPTLLVAATATEDL